MKELQDIIKKVSKRYDVEYDAESTNHKMKCKDGSIKSLDMEEIENLFFEQTEIDSGWYQSNSFPSNQVRKLTIEQHSDKNNYNLNHLDTISC